MGRKRTDRVTLNDVAQRVGVSASTVSYILRKVEPHYSRYAEATVRKVEAAAEEIGYSPNLLASSLRLQHVPYFGIFFEFVRPGDWGPMGGLSAMMWQVYEGIASTARRDHRYPVVLTSPDPRAGLADSPEELDGIVRSGLGGVIAAVFRDTWSKHLARWEQSGIPCISLFDAGTEDRPRWCVDLDNEAVGRMAWSYLWQHGHRRMLCVYHKAMTPAVAQRHASFDAQQESNGQSARLVGLTCTPSNGERFSEEDAVQLLAALDDTGATALFACDGASSVIAHEVLVAHGIDVPGRCSLIGIDVPIWSPEAPIVTQVACPGRKIGEQAARLLAGRITGSLDSREQVFVPPVLEERASVAEV